MIVAKRTPSLNAYTRSRVKIKRVVRQAREVYNKVDHAINVIAVNETILQTFVHDKNLQEVSHATAMLQNDFSVATKVWVLSGVARVLFGKGTLSPANVATYIGIFMLIILRDIASH